MTSKSIKVQKLNDGFRNTTIKITGLVDGQDYTLESILDAAALDQVDGFGTKAKTLRVTEINYDIEDGLQVDLIWGGTSTSVMWYATGRGEMEGCDFGGIVDDATGSNNTILLSTTGGTGSTTGALSFSLVLEIVKAN